MSALKSPKFIATLMLCLLIVAVYSQMSHTLDAIAMDVSSGVLMGAGILCLLILLVALL